MKKFVCSLYLFTAVNMFSQMPALTQELEPEVNSVLQTFSIDLDDDGIAESIELHVASKDEESRTDQLQVKNAQGDVLWMGPVYKQDAEYDNTQPYFGAWPFGISDISLVTDLGEDGVIDLLARAPQSDVRPTTWRLFQWDQRAFESYNIGRFIETKTGSGLFSWESEETDGNTWINQLKLDGPNFSAEIYALQKNGELHIGQAQLALDKKGFRLIKWLKKPSKV